eukprot:CFRG3451T1
MMENEQTRDSANAVPTTPSICLKCCMFFGNPVNDGLCSQCYKTANEPTKTTTTPKIVVPEVSHGLDRKADEVNVEDVKADIVSVKENEETFSRKVQKNKGKCWSCKKKVMFAKQVTNKCRCDYIFCDEHRQAEAHACDFGYKETGREHLAKMNPQVLASKLGKI